LDDDTDLCAARKRTVDQNAQVVDDDINQEDSWAVISAYFEEKGLVRQQVVMSRVRV
jgi:hypothetical protein